MSKRFCIFQPSIFKYHPDESGSSTALIEYDDKGKIVHTVIIDTGSADCDSIKAYKALKITTIDAFVFSHPHEDHMGYFKKFAENFEVKSAYFPTKDAFNAHSAVKGRASYIETIRKQAITECGEANVHYLKKGDSFTVGENIKCDVIFQVDYKKLKEIDSHHYVNNMSLGTLFTLTDIYGRTWTYYGAGDCAKEANEQFCQIYTKNKPLDPDFAHVQWHGDQAASSSDYCFALAPQYALMDYHHSYKSSGRTMTIDRFNKAGCRVLGNYLYGDIYCDIYDEGHASIYADKALIKIKWMKYKAKVQMLNDMQLTAYACLVFAGTYGKDPERAAQLKVRFGEKNAKLIQQRVNALAKNNNALKYGFVATILNSYFGSGEARQKNLGDYKDMAQKAVNEVYNRKAVDYVTLAKEIKAGKWGDVSGVIKVLTHYKKYNWEQTVEACKKIGVKL